MELVPMIWIAIGILLLLIELVLPGAVFGFVGAAAIFTGLLVQFGHVSGMLNISMTFFISAIFFVLVLRTALLKFFPSDSVVQNTDETQAAIGTIVNVTDAITPYKRGRISYLDTSWQAQADVELAAGDKAVISGRDGNCWIVKSIEGN